MSDDIVYAVERWNWRWMGEGRLQRLPGTRRIQSYDTFDEAEVYRAERETKARLKINPFLCGTCLHDRTSFDPPRWHDWLLDAGVDPATLPANPDSFDWSKWWEAQQPDWSEYQRAKVWEGLDKVRFFEVMPMPRRPVVYVISRICWSYNDSWYDAEEAEGGLALVAYRSREKAVARLRELDAEERENWGGRGLDYGDRAPALYDPTGDEEFSPTGEVVLRADQVPLHEVIEVDLFSTEEKDP